MIFKVQLPLSGPELAMIYNRDRSWEGLLPITDALRQAMGGKVKAFFHGKVDEEGVVHLDGQAPWQDW